MMLTINKQIVASVRCFGVLFVGIALFSCGFGGIKKFEKKLDSKLGWNFDTYQNIPPATVLPIIGTEGSNSVYKEVIPKQHCTIYWTVDPKDRIVGWKHEGKGCKYLTF